jgi:hypothetical protein
MSLPTVTLYAHKALENDVTYVTYLDVEYGINFRMFYWDKFRIFYLSILYYIN